MQLGAESPAVPSARQLHELRQACALNHFKQAVLGDVHRPGEPQEAAVMRAFADAGMDGCLDSRTWKGWFGDPARKAGPKGMANLDEYFLRMRQLLPSHASSSSPSEPRPAVYADLIAGGLVEELVQRTTAKPPIKTLRHRAFTYQPTSPLHLHLDAIECALWFEADEVACEELKVIAAKRVLDLIYDRWKPGQGSIYKELSSSLRLQWNRSDEQARGGIREFFSKLVPDRFEARMNEAPSPDWERVAVSEDFASGDIHKVLLQLAAETEFLVADRFDAWVIDLVSAGIAVYALAQANPPARGGFGLGPASTYWDAIRELFFCDEPDIDVRECLEQAFEQAGGFYNEDVERNLFTARAKYRTWLEGLGLSPRIVSNFADFQSLCPKLIVGG